MLALFTAKEENFEYDKNSWQICLVIIINVKSYDKIF